MSYCVMPVRSSSLIVSSLERSSCFVKITSVSILTSVLLSSFPVGLIRRVNSVLCQTPRSGGLFEFHSDVSATTCRQIAIPESNPGKTIEEEGTRVTMGAVRGGIEGQCQFQQFQGTGPVCLRDLGRHPDPYS